MAPRRKMIPALLFLINFIHLGEVAAWMDKDERRGAGFFDRESQSVMHGQAAIQTLEKLIALVIINEQGKSDLNRKYQQSPKSPQREVA